MTDINSDAVRLKSAARHYRYEKHLEDAADLFERDPQAWSKLPVQLQDQSGLYLGFRRDYRRAVKAGLIEDDRGPAKPDNHRY